ncbi:hypothetical protein [Amycolatopsis sp. GM8]|uniref:hypothetical protein n=1 Tax=Amycolatopsis sp. GM8 TaxID=2896530 RepID=UPI001F376C13|nr:hypothetical protein [Amycolatopsis sp. GM8]
MTGSDNQYGGGTPTSSVPLGDNSQSAAIVQQARSSAGGFDYGSDRAIASPPNWASQESDQLYQGATQNNDPATAEATGHTWKSHGDELHQAANDLYNAITELGAVWIGQGAGGAQGALVGIANSSQQAGDAAHTMSSRMAQQASAAAEVKKMPAPKEFDPAKQTAAMLAGGPAAMVADMKQQADEAKSVHEQQVQYFNAYTQAMSEVDDSTPSFGPESLGLPPQGSIAGTTKASSVGAAGAIPGAYGAGSLGPMTGMQVGGGDFAGHASAFGGHIGDAAQFAGAGAAGGPGAQIPGTPGAPGAPGTPGTPAGPSVVSGAGVSPAAHATPVPTSGGGGGAALGVGLGLAGAGLGAAAGKAVLGRGNKSGAKENPDETAAASTDQAQQQGNSAAGNMPQQPVMSPNGTIGGTTTPPPAGMGGGMGGMGAGGAQGQEDEEHSRASYLVEADPDAAFGANVATAPPVIGAWTEEEDE